MVGDPSLLAECKTEPTPPVPGPPDQGGRGPTGSWQGAQRWPLVTAGRRGAGQAQQFPLPFI